MTEFEQFLMRAMRRWGDSFDPSHLCRKFVPYYNSNQRIKVRLWEDEEDNAFGVMTGTVGVTTDWRPSFLLMLRADSSGSPWLLDDSCKILAVKIGRNYVELQEAI